MRPSMYTLDSTGTPVPSEDAREWGRWMEGGNRIIQRTELESGVRVSTVFLGIDHNFFGGEPLLFETMIFGGPLDEYQWRYSTRQEALKGHDEAVWAADLAGKIDVEAEDVHS